MEGAGTGISLILQGHVLRGLAQLPDESVQCVVTSPPYWGLRDYGTAQWDGGDPTHAHDRVAARGGRGGSGSPGKQTVGAFPSDLPAAACACGAVREDAQLGLERTPDEYVARMVEVFAEVRRVLRADGTLWLNIGDSYSGSGKGGNPHESPFQKQATNAGSLLVAQTARDAAVTNVSRRLCSEAGMKPKDLIGIPWMLAFALRAAGWYLRSDIIWSKPNPMPESVTDRPTKAHEYLFLLSKSAKYFYDADAIKEPGVSAGTTKMPDGWNTAPGAHGSFHPEGREKGRKTDKQRGHSRRHAGFNDRWDAMEDEQCSGMRNKRTVWTIAPKPFKGAHFATFPPALVEPCILAGSRPGDIILDPFGGSMTTGCVALQHGRDFYGIELSAPYVELGRARLLKETGVEPIIQEV